MEIDINGDPGTGNHFDDVHIQQVGNYSPNAKQAIFNTIHQDKAESRLACWFRRLNDEFEKDNKLKKKFDDIRRYKTKLPPYHRFGSETEGWWILRESHREGTSLKTVFCQEIN